MHNLIDMHLFFWYNICMFSQEYISAIVIVLLSVLKMFNIEIASESLTGLVTGLIAVWIAIRRYQKGDITFGGIRK